MFQVPDDDGDDDNDSLSSSREGSVQVLDSHPRSFSVPSSDSESDSDVSEVESIEIASSMQDDKEENSTPTTPDEAFTEKETTCVDVKANVDQLSPQSKLRGLKLKGPSIIDLLSKPAMSEPIAVGSSQQNAINIEDEDSHDQNVPDVESESEGPEHLPIQRAIPSRDRSLTWEEPPLSRHQYTIPSVADEETDLDNEDQLERIIVETQARVGKGKAREFEQSYSPPPPLNSSIGASDGFDSADDDDDDGFDVDDDFGYGSEEDLADIIDAPIDPTSNKVSRGSKPDVISQPEKPRETHHEPSADLPGVFRAGRSNLSISDGINVSQNPFKEFSPQQRAPSPSDAALAKNSLDMLPGAVNFDNYQSNMVHNHLTPIDNSHGTNTNGFENSPFGYQYLHPMSYSGFANTDTHSKPYDQGPFTNRYFEEFPAQQSNLLTYRTASGQTRSKKWRTPVEPELGRYQDIAADARYAAQLQAEEDAYRTSTFDSKNLTYKPEKESEAQSSKINIANLVNDSHVENSRPLKRKADEMSSASEADDALEGVKIIESTKTPSNPLTKSAPACGSDQPQETQLPDAQMRDSLPPIETVPLTQESTLEPVGESISISSATDVREAEGPARKKARTSSHPPRGIGKFVSGVCVGLVGAFAAFVATIPASVQEEALRELANAA